MKYKDRKLLKHDPQPRYTINLTDQVYSHLPTALLANTIISMLLAVVLWNEVSRKILCVWLSALWVITIGRYVLYYLYRSRSDESSRNWTKHFVVGVILTGIVWGSSGIFLLSENSLPHQIFLAFVIGGMVSGATTSLSGMQWVLRVFVCLLILPIILRFIFIGGEIYYAMGTMLSIYGLMCIYMSSNIYSMLIESILLRYENIDEIEERKKTEEELSRQKNFLEGVLTNIEDGIVVCDEKGVLSFFNRATQIFHGVEQEQLPPEKWATHYDLYLPDGVTPMNKEDIPLFRAFNGENIIDVEMVIAPKKGKKRTLLASGRPLIDELGMKYGAFVSMHDVTERKKAEDFLKKAHEQLELKVQERTKELEKALDEVKTLRGILPICCHCKKIRNDEGYYEQIEMYIHKHSGVDFSHTICPTCLKKFYPEIIND